MSHDMGDVLKDIARFVGLALLVLGLAVFVTATGTLVLVLCGS